MNFIERYKAEIITCLLTGILVLGMFSIKLKQKGQLITESYYEIEPEPEPAKELMEELLEKNTPATDKAFNEDEAYKQLMKNFKTIESDDFERTVKAMEASKNETTPEAASNHESLTNTKDYTLKPQDTEAFKKLQEELQKRLKNKKIADEHASSQSTLTYSLVDRVLEYYKTPRYLCEYGGKIVVNITVDRDGYVQDAYVNQSSTSNNPCLVEHAIDYARTAKFNPSSKREQLGTITFIFKDKR